MGIFKGASGLSYLSWSGNAGLRGTWFSVVDANSPSGADVLSFHGRSRRSSMIALEEVGVKPKKKRVVAAAGKKRGTIPIRGAVTAPVFAYRSAGDRSRAPESRFLVCCHDTTPSSKTTPFSGPSGRPGHADGSVFWFSFRSRWCEFFNDQLLHGPGTVSALPGCFVPRQAWRRQGSLGLSRPAAPPMAGLGELGPLFSSRSSCWMRIRLYPTFMRVPLPGTGRGLQFFHFLGVGGGVLDGRTPGRSGPRFVVPVGCCWRSDADSRPGPPFWGLSHQRGLLKGFRNLVSTRPCHALTAGAAARSAIFWTRVYRSRWYLPADWAADTLATRRALAWSPGHFSAGPIQTQDSIHFPAFISGYSWLGIGIVRGKN